MGRQLDKLLESGQYTIRIISPSQISIRNIKNGLPMPVPYALTMELKAEEEAREWREEWQGFQKEIFGEDPDADDSPLDADEIVSQIRAAADHGKMMDARTDMGLIDDPIEDDEYIAFLEHQRNNLDDGDDSDDTADDGEDSDDESGIYLTYVPPIDPVPNSVTVLVPQENSDKAPQPNKEEINVQDLLGSLYSISWPLSALKPAGDNPELAAVCPESKEGEEQADDGAELTAVSRPLLSSLLTPRMGTEEPGRRVRVETVTRYEKRWDDEVCHAHTIRYSITTHQTDRLQEMSLCLQKHRRIQQAQGGVPPVLQIMRSGCRQEKPQVPCWNEAEA